jgi:hypothetical protein
MFCEGRGKREEGRGKREEGRGKKEEGRGKRVYWGAWNRCGSRKAVRA